ncbi:MAG TPA: hypothetical protein VFP88_04265 [Rhodanobacteraceae bacterium]|nr:hypothetical protein [Rhodanobacteraceae bacterium]
MEITQKSGSAKTRYVFNDERLEYAWSDRSGSRSFSVSYTEISRDRQTLTERSTWFRNVGLLWMGLGLIWILLSWSRNHGANGWFWFVLGAGCYAVYHFRVTRYVIIPCEKGNLLVIDDEDGKRLINEIETRRAAQFREEYDFFPESDSPEQLRKRFKWLHSEGALSDEEFKQRMDKVEAQRQPPQADQATPGERLLH